MAVEVVMPKLGMAMKEGTVSLWNKAVGDSVGKGEPIASVNSEKIEIDVESPAEGTVLKIEVPEGEGVPPGTVICYIGNPGEEVGTQLTSEPAQNAKAETQASKNEKTPSVKAVKKSEDRMKISPVARKMAEAGNLDIEKIQGTGPGGRITKEDVQEALKTQRGLQADQPKEARVVPQRKPVEKSQTQQVPLSGIRKVIAVRMHDSLQKSAQLTINIKVDVTDLIALQKQTAETVQKKYGHKLTVTDFIARSVVLSLKNHQDMNSALIEDKIHLFKQVHLGMAVALEKGLVVPVIRNVDESSLIDLSRNIKELAQKARQGQLSNEDMKGSTFTISNLGAYGVEHFTPVLNPPETGILGVGAVNDTPVYLGEKLERRSILPLSLTFDHRVLDGAPAAAFLQTVKQYLEAPITMLL
ncbi:dihydrolipoamide acetyltransferase family protein [Neobacillus niacini]|uniref:dihydrolipoamide acetyltransferase family protein n=1 Tax=Neobacillus niacini TaxID=86668 RepID=UPI00285CBC8D|nr:dihydrolipoamide acetyltransferase family protein [Neobacillus niacini]MDR6999151.1 pyruvate dehydrogenase E2 component (dihydrolipoamide acetyltransferase) [Neobacillus niacini]